MNSKDLNGYANKLINFIYDSPTAFHATKNIVNRLKENNFTELSQSENWKLEKGGKYFTVKNDSAVIAFVVGNKLPYESGFRLIGAHTDSPTFKIKPENIIDVEDTYIKVNTEVYGSPIYSTWFDRPLSMAGKVVLKSKDAFKPKEIIVNIDRPLMVIPNLAIHFNREVNNGYKYNAQIDTLPLLGLISENLEKDNYILKVIANELNIDMKEIIDFELYLYEYEKGTIMGLNDEFISSSRLDDLWMVYAGLEALLNSTEVIDETKVLVCLDNEEIGSATAEGADSLLLRDTLERINLSFRECKEDLFISLSKSIMISADLAHAIHPNHIDKHDLSNRPVLGEGPVIKYSSNQKYTTSCVSASVFAGICEAVNVPFQKFVNRSDIVGGSTISRFISSNLGITVIDMGAPLLAMHSIRELGTVKDNYYTIEAFTSFFSYKA